MKYIYNGEYRTFRGYVFMHGHPVDITDRGTLEAIRRERDFKEYLDEKVEVEKATEAQILNAPEIAPTTFVSRKRPRHL